VNLISTMRLHRKKRPRQLVRAFAHAVRRTRSPSRLVIVGDGPERSKLERLVRDTGVRVELAGWRARAQLKTLYATADGFVLPSIREAFGIAALEARAAGLPVIAMRASGSTEFLRDGLDALICRNDEDLVGQIARFIRDPALRATLAEAPVSLERYDWNTVIASHEAAYRRAMKRAVSGALAVASA
jgi:glycosyltransferase involved in cell wall biosynthesis